MQKQQKIHSRGFRTDLPTDSLRSCSVFSHLRTNFPGSISSVLHLDFTILLVGRRSPSCLGLGFPKSLVSPNPRGRTEEEEEESPRQFQPISLSFSLEAQLFAQVKNEICQIGWSLYKLSLAPVTRVLVFVLA